MPRISTTEAIQIIYEVVTLIENNIIIFHYGLRSNRYSRDFSIFVMDGTRLRVDRKPVLVHPAEHVNREKTIIRLLTICPPSEWNLVPNKYSPVFPSDPLLHRVN
jgi:hypothetical protein